MNMTTKKDVKTEVAELLKPILADQHILYTKLRNYHWNITGKMFFNLHTNFETLYTDLALDIDEIAERIRSLGVYAPGTMTSFLKLAGLKEEKEDNYPVASAMVENLINDYEYVVSGLKNSALKMQTEYSDEVTAGYLYSLAQKYEKHNWMLHSLLN